MILFYIFYLFTYFNKVNVTESIAILCVRLCVFPPQFRLVVKTALKLLLVFVEYSECNAPLLIEAITSVDTKRGTNNLTDSSSKL